MKSVHLQVMLWRAADRQGPPILDIAKCGWDMKSGLPSPSLDTGPAALDGMIDIIRNVMVAELQARLVALVVAAVRDTVCHTLHVYCSCKLHAISVVNP